MSNGIHNFLDLSNGHLPQGDFDSINMIDGPLTIRNFEYGFSIWMPSNDRKYINEILTEVEEDYKISTAFRKIMLYALENDCWLINFDADAEQIDNLDYYDW
jgi:hypothetical protein